MKNHGDDKKYLSRQIRGLLCLFAVMTMELVLMTWPAYADEPRFPSGAPWFNVSRPLNSTDLKGRFTLLDFFTPGCINCIHTIPGMNRLEHEFGKYLLIIGVNSPKFSASKNVNTIRGFIERYDIRHPIVTDKHMQLWKQYGVFAWPTFILLGPNGHKTGRFIGEGQYGQIRKAVIKSLNNARQQDTLGSAIILPLKTMIRPDTPLLQPGKVAVSNQYVAVSDTGHDQVVLFSHHGKVIQIIGNGHPGAEDGKASQASFNGPQGLAFHRDMLYVADSGNHLIRQINLNTFRVNTIAGNGRQQFGVRGQHQALQVSLNSPWALKVIGNTLYVAMAGDHQIWKMSLLTQRIGPFAGTGYEGITDGTTTQASFAQCSGLAYHNSLLYVADPESSAVRTVNLNNFRVNTLIGHGLFVFGMHNGTADKALLQHNQGLAYLNGKLYIADTFNDAIRTLNLKTNQVTTLATGLSQPGGLAILNKHRLIVADTNHNRVITVNITNGDVTPWPISGLNPPISHQ